MRNEREANVLLGQRSDPAEPWTQQLRRANVDAGIARHNARAKALRWGTLVVIAFWCVVLPLAILVAKGCAS